MLNSAMEEKKHLFLILSFCREDVLPFQVVPSEGFISSDSSQYFPYTPLFCHFTWINDLISRAQYHRSDIKFAGSSSLAALGTKKAQAYVTFLFGGTGSISSLCSAARLAGLQVRFCDCFSSSWFPRLANYLKRLMWIHLCYDDDAPKCSILLPICRSIKPRAKC